MRRTLATFAVLAMAFAGSARADNIDAHDDGTAAHNSIGLGFHSVDAPVGLRWWFSGQKVGLDVGVGVASHDASGTDEKVTDFTLEAGVPFVVRSWDRLHFMVRPGILYASRGEVFPVLPSGFDKESSTEFAGRLELESEVFLARNFSVSASHGIEFTSSKPAVPSGAPDAESTTTFSTIGGNFTTVGFHVYGWGGSR